LNGCPSGKMIAYCDGASHGSPGPAGAGVHLECPGNNGVVTISWPLGARSSAEAEYEAVILALRVARGLGVLQLEIRTDHESLAEQLNGGMPRSPVLRSLWLDAQAWLNQFGRNMVQIVWEPRAGNNDRANELAGQAAGSNLDYAEIRRQTNARSKG
jgi:ribonuclease HI